MQIRGERECRDCGHRWSYYERGTVTCPQCGSLRSRGVDERTRHTDAAATLDVSAARSAAAADSRREAAREASNAVRRYVGRRGFIDAGELRPLDATFLAAHELGRAADAVRRGLAVDDEEERYFLTLLQGADGGERPAPKAVPPSMRAARGLAAAAAVAGYRREVATWLRDRDVPPAARGALERLDDHRTRIEMLDGDVPPAAADRLVEATRALGEFLRSGEESELDRANALLDALSVE